MFPEPGRRYGPYEILGRLGGGGMGFVFRAWDSRLHREVALKLLHDEFAMPGMRERFLREARAASALNHPNICTIFDIGEQDGDPYLVMELLEGVTLKERIQKSVLGADEIVCIAKEVAEALGAAHAKGIIHRDIKPANVFLVQKPNGSFQTKILDFGLAKIEHGGPSSRGGGRSIDITTAGATVGTLSYMSPEQARGEQLDSRSDLFSLGIVMYEMATRRIPFPGATSALVFVKLLNEQPDPVRDWNDAIPRELEKIIFKLIAKERTARFQTAAELDTALRQLEERAGGPGNWLRKAVGTVPLVRAPEPIAARERRPLRKPDSQPAPIMPLADEAQVEQPRAGSDAQFFKPVARIPRGDTPRPAGDVAPAASVSPATVGAGPAVLVESAPLRRVAAESGSPAEATAVISDPAVAAPRGSSAQRRRPAAPIEDEQVSEAADEQTVGARARFASVSPRLILYGLVSLAVLGIAGVFLLHHGRFGPAPVSADERVVFTSVENETGDASLDDVAGEGLSLALLQSPYLRLVRSDSYATARRLTLAATSPDRIAQERGQLLARNNAQRLHAQAYFFGYLKNTRPPYVLEVDLFDTESGDVKLSAQTTFDGPGGLTDSIDHLAQELRAQAGESESSIRQTSVPLAQEATANLEALRGLAEAQGARAAGDTLSSLRLLDHAAALDPHCPQVQLELVSAYRRLRSETSSAAASQRALAAADAAGERTKALAEYEYEMNVTGDDEAAIATLRKLLTRYPHDSEVLSSLARSLRLIGHVSEALQAAQQAYAEDPYDADAYTQAENSMVALDRFDAAYQLDMQAQQLGMARPGGSIAAAYLDDRQSGVAQAIDALTHAAPWYAQQWYYGIYLDNIGKLDEGTAAWQTFATTARRIPGLESTAGFLLAQGAYDRSLIDDCKTALSLAHQANGLPLGPTAVFNLGMAAALCHEPATAEAAIARLESGYPKSFAVHGYYLADLQGALALSANDPQRALDVLQSARQFDLISLTPYLRGRAHVALHQEQIGIVDFQTVLSHRGIPFVVGNEAYPAAQIGVARAFLAIGDTHNSAEAYEAFLNLWRNADPRQPLLLEARAHRGR